MAHLGASASVEIDAPLEEVWAVVENVIAAPVTWIKIVRPVPLRAASACLVDAGERVT